MKNILEKQKILEALVESEHFNKDTVNFVLKLSDKDIKQILKLEAESTASDVTSHQIDVKRKRNVIAGLAGLSLLSIISLIASIKFGKIASTNPALKNKQISILRKIRSVISDPRMSELLSETNFRTGTLNISIALYMILEYAHSALMYKCNRQYRLPIDRHKCMTQAYETLLTKLKSQYNQCGSRWFPKVCRLRMENIIKAYEAKKRKHLQKSVQ